jgi:WD40 repeat protein
MCLTLIKKFKKFASASADTIRVWNIIYKDHEGSRKIIAIECFCSFANNGLVLTMLSPINHENLLIIGSRDGAIRYLDIDKRELIKQSIQGKDFIGDTIIIEKSLKMLDKDKNHFNILTIADGVLRVQDHDGVVISTLSPINHEDFCSSNVLPNRGMTILKIYHNSREFLIKIAVASQYASQYFNFKSSRITIVNLRIKNF